MRHLITIRLSSNDMLTCIVATPVLSKSNMDPPQHGGASRKCPRRTADGPRPQHVGPLRRTAKTRSFCAWPNAANRDGSRSVEGSAKCARHAGQGRFKPPRSSQDWDSGINSALRTLLSFADLDRKDDPSTA